MGAVCCLLCAGLPGRDFGLLFPTVCTLGGGEGALPSVPSRPSSRPPPGLAGAPAMVQRPATLLEVARRGGAGGGGGGFERPLRRFRREGDSHHVSQNVFQRGKAVVQRHWARCLFVFVFLRYFTPLPLLWTLEDGDIVTHLSWAAELWPEPKACPEASALAWSTSYFVLLVPSTQSSLD